ncbi:hypothetical protein GE300_10390 [Rhodobacteraceae bacterium 2CG4]|uniref:Uncharacterized protein n=1 Tax=Halovulum marinum TaxID=2662447 RepID=A0A6L5Z0K2_9RHOB|nr:hypothetical protein [Halovulum marinum]MSU90018.1 hypothetical protein [Halovulum marinum]
MRARRSVTALAAALAAALALAAPATVAAEDPPRSAIPWLSEVLRTGAAPPDGTAPGGAARPTVRPFDPGVIETRPLDLVARNGVGILAPHAAGLPRDLWGGASAPRVRRLIAEHRAGGVPAARALFRTLLLTETVPPAGSGPENRVLLARIDALMEAGMLDAAEALVDAAGVTDPELFRRAFDIGLLTGRVDDECEQLRGSPALSPTLPARVYCLARLGDWPAAALTLSLGREVGDIAPAQETALAWFLDPAAFEGLEPPPVPEPLTTLDYVVREAVALPRPARALPLAFLVPDAAGDSPLKTRITAREKLVRAGAMPPALLFEAYRAGTPAASGGVWDRAAAVQALDRALALADPQAIVPALRAADRMFSEVDLRPALAQVYLRQLKALPPDAYPADLRQEVGALLLLAGAHAAAVPWFPDDNDVSSRYLAALAAGAPALPDTAALAPLQVAAVAGLTTDAPPTEDALQIGRLIARGFTGEALMRTLALLEPGPEIDPGDLEAALYLLRAAGQDDVARQVAIETLLLLPPA